MSDDQLAKIAEALMLIAIGLGVAFVVDFTFHILSAINKCP